VKLDFSGLTQPTQEYRGQVGQPISMPFPESPKLSPVVAAGDKTTFSEAGTSICPPRSPEYPPLRGTPEPNVHEVVPDVPSVPPRSKQISKSVQDYRSDSAETGISLWIRARCTRRKDLWGSEKSLWVDYVGWRQQQTVSLITREEFAEILTHLLKREMDGWQGIALAIDVAPSERYII
jgi:hypothetical protein